jgi:hypothetical protein
MNNGDIQEIMTLQRQNRIIKDLKKDASINPTNKDPKDLSVVYLRPSILTQVDGKHLPLTACIQERHDVVEDFPSWNKVVTRLLMVWQVL